MKCTHCGHPTDVDSKGEPYALCQVCDLLATSAGESVEYANASQRLLDVAAAGVAEIKRTKAAAKAIEQYYSDDVQIITDDVEHVDGGYWVGARVWIGEQECE